MSRYGLPIASSLYALSESNAVRTIQIIISSVHTVHLTRDRSWLLSVQIGKIYTRNIPLNPTPYHLWSLAASRLQEITGSSRSNRGRPLISSEENEAASDGAEQAIRVA
jgi:hypothetical protein